VALDGRYRWIVGEDAGVKDVHGRGRTIGVGIEDGHVILQVGSPGCWVKVPQGVAGQLGIYLQIADTTLEQQTRSE